MVLKYVVLLLVLYLIVRAALNMWAAIQADDVRRHTRSLREDEPVRRRVQGRTYETVLNAQSSIRKPAAHGGAAVRRVDDARFVDVTKKD